MRVDMSPEDELCLLLARAQLFSRGAGTGAQAAGEPVAMAAGPRTRQGVFEVIPLLYAGLRTLGFPGVPDPVRSELAKLFRINGIRNELLDRELARILRLFADAGVPVMPLKGVALAESLYGDPALRVCSDINVLVPPAMLLRLFTLSCPPAINPSSPSRVCSILWCAMPSMAC